MVSSTRTCSVWIVYLDVQDVRTCGRIECMYFDKVTSGSQVHAYSKIRVSASVVVDRQFVTCLIQELPLRVRGTRGVEDNTTFFSQFETKKILVTGDSDESTNVLTKHYRRRAL